MTEIPFSKYNSLGNLISFLQEHGVRINNGNCFCFNPMHDNKDTEAMTLFQDGDGVGRFSCKNPTCGIHGDIYDAAEILAGCKDKVDQYNYVATRFGGVALESNTGYSIAPVQAVIKPIEKVEKPKREIDPLAELSVRKIMENHPVRKPFTEIFLRTRGYSEEQIPLLVPHFLYWPGFSYMESQLGKQKLYKARIPLPKKGTDLSSWDPPGVVIPMGSGWKLHFYEPGNSKCKKLGSIQCESITGFNGDKAIQLVEGEIDGLVMRAQGEVATYSLGTSTMTKEAVALVIESGITDITLMMDGDDAGYKAAGLTVASSTGKLDQKSCIPKKLRDAGYQGNIWIKKLPAGEDPDSMFRKGIKYPEAIRFEDIIPEGSTDLKVSETMLADEDFWPFRFLGVKNNTHYFISRSQEVISTSAMSMVRQFFIALAPLAFWQTIKVGSSGSPDWEYMNDLLYERSVQQGPYNPANIRGSGIWEDEGEIIYSDGQYVYSEKRGTHRVSEFPSKKYTYIMSNGYGIESRENPQWKDDYHSLMYICEMLSFKTPEHGKLLIGWIISSFFLGVIDWRPIVYMKGPSSVGKSWTLNNVVRELLGDICVCPTKSSTAKGIMQAPGYDSRMTTVDELESSGQKKQQELIQELMTIARDSTTRSREQRHTGTSDQQGVSREYRSMFLFASIVESSEEDQDVNRITAVEFAQRDKGIPWSEISDTVLEMMDGGLGERLRGDVVFHRDSIIQNIKIFRRVASGLVSKQRNADQMGTLIAGWYSITNPGHVATTEEAREEIQRFDFTEQEERSQGKTMKVILGSVLSYKIRYEEEQDGTIKQRNRSIYDILCTLRWEAGDVTRHPLNRELQNYGLRFGTKNNPGKLIMACNHEGVKKMMPEGFPYKNNYRDYFKNHPWYTGKERSCRFSGIVYEAMVFDVDLEDESIVVKDGEGLF